MMPSPPAFDTAEASWALAIQPIGACTIGISMPRVSVIRLRKGRPLRLELAAILRP